jgi:hypothetical protein
VSEFGRAELAGRFRRHGGEAVFRASPLYAELMMRVGDDIAAGGPSWSVLEGHEHDRPGTVPSLRFMGSVHRLVLSGRAPELARHYPSAGGDASDPAAAWPAFVATVEQHAAELRELVNRPVQTNEVGRAGALLGGFLEVSRATGLPLRLLEVGASAGLLLRWDRYRYEADGRAWGDPASGLRLAIEGEGPPLDARADVAERLGCDRNPLDPASEEDRLTLRSFLWPDQDWRRDQLDAALEIAGRVPAGVERARAADWVEGRLAEPAGGTASVVYHSLVAQYFPDDERARFERALAEAGARATPEAPLAWLRMEGAGELCDVRLTLWPGGEERLLARAGYHGRPVRWLEPSA